MKAESRNRELGGLPALKDDFGRLVSEVYEKMQGEFPNTAAMELNIALSETTKESLLKLPADQVGRILVGAIDEINHGSVESLEELVNKRLEQ